MARPTSVESYYKALYGGLINRTRKALLTVLLEWDWSRYDVGGPIDSGDGLSGQEAGSLVSGFDRQSGRFTELREMGLIYENGTKICSITKNNVISWMPTWGLYVKTITKKETQAEKIKKLEKDIERKNNLMARASINIVNLKSEIRRLRGIVYENS